MRYLFFIILCFLNLNAINFDALKHSAIQYNTSLKIKQSDLDISKQNKKIVEADYYPSLDLIYSTEKSNSYTNNNVNTSVGDYNISSSDAYKNYSYLSLSYNLFDFGRLENKVAIEKNRIRLSTYTLCQEKNDVIQELLENYYDARIAHIKKETLEKVLRFNLNKYDNNTRLNQQGHIRKTEVLEQAVKVAELNKELLQLDESINEKYQKIQTLSHYRFDKNEILDPLTLQTIEKKKFNNTPEYKMYQSQINIKKAELRFIKSEHYPKVNLFSKYDFYGQDQDSFKEGLSDISRNSYRYGLTLTLNLFNGFKIKNQEKKALYELKKIEQEQQEAKEKFDERINIIQHQINTYNHTLIENEKSFDLSLTNADFYERLKSIGEISDNDKIEVLIKKLYAYSDLQQTKESLAYNQYKNNLIINGEKECIVH